MVNITQTSPLGGSIQSGEIDDGAVTFLKLGTDTERWRHLETVTFAGESTKTSGTLTACSQYKLFIKLYAASETTAQLTFNGDTTAGHYTNEYFDNVTLTYDGSDAYIRLMTIDTNNYGTAVLFMNGLTQTVANGTIATNITASGLSGAGKQLGVNGRWYAGSAVQIETMTIYTGVATTGTIEIYGR